MFKDYQNLKRENLPLLHQKQTNDVETLISEEDMRKIDQAKWNILLYPVYALAGSFVLAQGLRTLSLPGFFGNPIAPDDRVLYRQKYVKYFLSNQMLFFGFLSGFCVGYVKYEFTKYYLSLKYRKLINAYLDACEKNYLNRLKETGDAIEIDIKRDILHSHQKI